MFAWVFYRTCFNLNSHTPIGICFLAGSPRAELEKIGITTERGQESLPHSSNRLSQGSTEQAASKEQHEGSNPSPQESLISSPSSVACLSTGSTEQAASEEQHEGSDPSPRESLISSPSSVTVLSPGSQDSFIPFSQSSRQGSAE